MTGTVDPSYGRGAPVTLRDCKRVTDSCQRARFKRVAVGVNRGAGPFCVMAWMRSSTAAAVRSEGVTCGMVYVEGKKATLSLLGRCCCCDMFWWLVCICGSCDSGQERGRHTIRVGRGWTSWFCVAVSFRKRWLWFPVGLVGSCCS